MVSRARFSCWIAAVVTGSCLVATSSAVAANGITGQPISPSARPPALSLPFVDCTQTPIPSGCVTALRFADPATIQQVPSPDGGLSFNWSLAGGTTQKLTTPIPLAQAWQMGLSGATQHGLFLAPAEPIAAVSARSRRAYAAAAYGQCNVDWNPPYRVNVGNNNSHIHAISHQQCGPPAATNWINTYVLEGSTFTGGDLHTAPGTALNTTDAYAVCGSSPSAHIWQNWSDFWAYTADGSFTQGPYGAAFPESYACDIHTVH